MLYVYVCQEKKTHPLLLLLILCYLDLFSLLFSGSMLASLLIMLAMQQPLCIRKIEKLCTTRLTTTTTATTKACKSAWGRNTYLGTCIGGEQQPYQQRRSCSQVVVLTKLSTNGLHKPEIFRIATTKNNVPTWKHWKKIKAVTFAARKNCMPLANNLRWNGPKFRRKEQS